MQEPKGSTALTDESAQAFGESAVAAVDLYLVFSRGSYLMTRSMARQHTVEERYLAQKTSGGGGLSEWYEFACHQMEGQSQRGSIRWELVEKQGTWLGPRCLGGAHFINLPLIPWPMTNKCWLTESSPWP